MLIDTHVLIWSRADSPRLSRTARRLIDSSAEVLVSAATIYEIEYKRRSTARRRPDRMLQRMPPNLVADLPPLGYTLVGIAPEIAESAANLALDHPDPWDRILLATAQVMNVPLLTADTVLHEQAPDLVLW